MGFSREACKEAWEKIGAAPLTKKCLNDNKVRKLVGDGDEEYDHLVKIIQEANNLSTHTLTENGYDSSAFKDNIDALQQRTNKIVTEENTIERRRALMDATTHGKKFSATGGFHLTSDDIFISAEMSVRGKENARLVKEKSRCEAQAAAEAKGTSRKGS